MKANELMIGDWFSFNGKAGQIGIIDNWDGEVSYFNGDAEGILTFGFDDIEPIPLTAEILEKNGFVKGGYTNLSPDYYLETEGYCIQVNLRRTPDKRDFLSVYSNNNPNPEVITYGCRGRAKWYVHELQRLLRICGLLELANNFKI